MDSTFDMNSGFFSKAVKNLLEQLESKLENGIIRILELEEFKEIIYNHSESFDSNCSISINAKQLFGLTVMEVWLSLKTAINLLFDNRSDIPKLKNMYDNIVTIIINGLKGALNKYHDAFNVYVSGKVNDILSSFYLALDNVDNQAGQELRKAISASLNIILDLNGEDVITRLRKAGLVLITGVAGIIKVDVVCANLYELILRLVEIVNTYKSILDAIIDMITQRDIDYFKAQKALVEEYNAELLRLDLDGFKKQTQAYEYVGERLSSAKTDDELNCRLKEIMHGLGIQMSWEKTHESFDAFMRDKNARMRFE